MKSEFSSISMKSLVSFAGLSYSSFMRWKLRVLNNELPVKKPGPKKILPLDFKALKTDIESLQHRKRRSFLTGILYKKYGLYISRRNLNQLVRTARYHYNHKAFITQKCINWQQPGLAWAIDGCEITTGCFKVYVQNLQDLCSVYKFNPLVTLETPVGEKIREYLSVSFKKFGVPLFLKRDNAKNLNTQQINDLLEEKMVIPLNSPRYYAQYNGSIEHAQGEFKSYIRQNKDKISNLAEFSLLIKNVTHCLNHMQRRKLKGKNACQSYFTSNKISYKKRERRDIFNWIRDLAFEISIKAGIDKIEPVAWRVACRKWMEENDMIKITKKEKVLPNFSLNLCHN